MIAFIGSVFSPYYAWSGRRDPYDHVSINIALYGKPRRWAMVDRGKAALDHGPDHFSVGPSALRWEADCLIIDVDEITVPLPGRLRGQIRFWPKADQPRGFALDTKNRHHWWPYAPFGRIEADFESPRLSWSGHGYADTNTGTQAMEADFEGWTWSRASTDTGATLFYEPRERSGARHLIAFDVDHNGEMRMRDAPPKVQLKTGLWGIKRTTRSEDVTRTGIAQTMLDVPFYTRDALNLVLDGKPCPAVHESLNLNRFASPWVKMLLPFKMPRRAGWPSAKQAS